MNEHRLFDFLEKQKKADLLELLGAAYATAHGGTIRVGVDPAGEAVGVRIGKGALEDPANKIKTNTEPPQYPSIAVEGPNDAAVIAVKIHESPIKPVWAFGRAMKRVGCTNERLSRDEAHRSMEAGTGRTWDALPCRGFTLEDVSDDAIGDFLRRADL